MVQIATLLTIIVSTLAVTSTPVVLDASPSVRVSAGTNAERIALGLSPLPPTKRSTAQKVKRSSASDDGTSTARRRYLVRVNNPMDGSDLGAISMPGPGSDGNADDDSAAFNPNTDRSRKFAFGPGHQEGQNFEISPAEDEDVFGRRGGMLAAVGRGRPSDLARGSPNFANLGMAHEGPDGLLNMNLPLDLGLPSKLLGVTRGGRPLAGETDGLMSPAGGLDLGLLDGILGDLSLVDVAIGPVKQLLSDPESINMAGSPQSAIWTFDPATRRLFAKYRNSNGEIVPTQFVTGGACPHLICMTADVDAFKGFWGDDAQEIYLSAGLL